MPNRVSRYTGARPLRTFEHLGETFVVVRWRDERGKHWRGYTTLLHDGAAVSDDIHRNSNDSWEVQLARMFPFREKLLESLATIKSTSMY